MVEPNARACFGFNARDCFGLKKYYLFIDKRPVTADAVLIYVVLIVSMKKRKTSKTCPTTITSRKRSGGSEKNSTGVIGENRRALGSLNPTCNKKKTQTKNGSQVGITTDPLNTISEVQYHVMRPHTVRRSTLLLVYVYFVYIIWVRSDTLAAKRETHLFFAWKKFQASVFIVFIACTACTGSSHHHRTAAATRSGHFLPNSRWQGLLGFGGGKVSRLTPSKNSMYQYYSCNSRSF